MACDLDVNPRAHSVHPSIIVNFDGSNICVRMEVFGIDSSGNSITVNKTYPISTSDIAIAEDMRNEFLTLVPSLTIDMYKRSIQIANLLRDSILT